MQEIWKDISNYETYYQVSSFGRIKSLSRKFSPSETILTPTESTFGYLQVSLTKNSINKTTKVHRLVALSFIDNPLNLIEVNHKDGNKKNNHFMNLEWCTRSENIKHACRLKLIINKNEENPNVKLKWADINRIRELNLEGVDYKDISKIYNVSKSCIQSIIHNRTWRNPENLIK